MPQLLLKLPVSRNSEIEFFQNFLIYKGEKILCSDIDGISYLYTRTKHSIKFIPTGTSHTYVIFIRARGILHKFSFSGQNNQETFSKFVNAIETIVKPFVVVNLLLDYTKSNSLEIGDLTITPAGLYKKRTWWRNPELLSWNEYYNSNIDKGNVFVLKRDDSKKEYSAFYTRTMSSLNAIVLPDVINFLFARKGVLDDVTKKQIIERKAQLTTASAQDAMQDLKRCLKCNEAINESQEFCASCGYALLFASSSSPIDKAAPEEEVETSQPASQYCPGCGSPVNKDVKFCGNCGAAIA